MAIRREVLEGKQDQSPNEEISYVITVPTKYGLPSSPTVVVYDITNNAYVDVTSTVMPSGSASVAGQEITLPRLKVLTVGKKYKVEFKFSASTNIFERYIIVECTP